MCISKMKSLSTHIVILFDTLELRYTHYFSIFSQFEFLAIMIWLPEVPWGLVIVLPKQRKRQEHVTVVNFFTIEHLSERNWKGLQPTMVRT